MITESLCLFAMGVTGVLGGSSAGSLNARANPDIKALFADTQNNWCSGTQVYYPSNPKYVNLTTQRWTSYEAPSYVASVKPACAEDVIKIVSCPS